MLRSLTLRFQCVILLLLAGVFVFHSPGISVNAAEISIGTVIDTVGMVSDRTSISQGTGVPGLNGSSSLYRDSTMTNGGSLALTKTVTSGGKTADTQATGAQKVLQYDAGTTGGHMALSENMITSSAGGNNAADSPVCTLITSGSSSQNHSVSSSASLDIVSATALQLTTRTRISPGDLEYSVSANTSLPSGNYSAPATVKTTFSYGSQTAEEMNRATDRSMVTGLFDLFNRVYRGGDGATIQAQTEGSGMVGSKTVAEHSFSQVNATEKSPGWSGSTVYAADILTNGGDLDETRSLTADSKTTSQRVVTYHANGSTSMQTQERLVATKEVATGANMSSDPRCVFVGSIDNNSTTASFQSVAASSQLMGVDSAQSTSRASLDIGNKNNGTGPLVADYNVDITSPIQFDAMLLQTMADQDKDGKYEDLNGNGHHDIQDLVLLFKNFEWLSKSSISPRFDYNSNGRVDFADLTHAFADVRKK